MFYAEFLYIEIGLLRVSLFSTLILIIYYLLNSTLMFLFVDFVFALSAFMFRVVFSYLCFLHFERAIESKVFRFKQPSWIWYLCRVEGRQNLPRELA